MSMDCRTFESLLADAIGGELGEADRSAFEDHAERCATCGAEYQSLERTLTSVRERVGAPSPGATGRATSAPRPSLSGWTAVRFAAAIALAFGAGYGLRGAGAGRSPTRVAKIPDAVTVHQQIADAHERAPEASSFAKSMLAVLGPSRRGDH